MSVKLDASCYYYIVGQRDVDLQFIKSVKTSIIKKGPPSHRVQEVMDNAILHVLGLFETSLVKHFKWSFNND